MKAVGLIVEYNPFHNGHVYHIQQAKEKSQAEVVIAVMSGNFVQRGAPAIFDKWTRSEMALKNGVDLVIELPFATAVSSADYFAKGAVSILDKLFCQSICFGTDDNSMDYEEFGKLASEHQEFIAERLAQLPNNLNYPAKMTLIWQELLKQTHAFNTPNHLLAISYAKANAKLSNPMQLIAIPRKAVDFHQLESVGAFASATAIRKQLINKEYLKITPVVPANTLEALKNAPRVDEAAMFRLLKYRVLSSSITELRNIHQMKEGLEYKIKKIIKDTHSLEEFLAKLKSKRYTHAYLSRLVIYLVLNVTDNEIDYARLHQSIHILGFSKKGQSYLSKYKKQFQLPVISTVGRDVVDLELDLKADAIYQILNAKVPEQNFGRFPMTT